MPIKGQVLAFIPSEPSAWDQFLARLGMSESEALAVARGSAPGPRAQVKNWVRRWRSQRYVPEAVIAALGLGMDAQSAITDARRITGATGQAALVARRG